jgi:hypothetical protein
MVTLIVDGKQGQRKKEGEKKKRLSNQFAYMLTRMECRMEQG